MNSSVAASRAERRAAKRAVGGGVALAILAGAYWADSAGDFAAYLLVIFSSLLPAVLWIRMGRPGVPVLPAMAALHILYYAFPIVRGRQDLLEYGSDEVFRGAATVSLFLVLAALVSTLFLRSIQREGGSQSGLLSDSQMTVLVFAGLGAGALFLGLSLTGWLAWMGPLYGVVRSISLTALVVASYFLGVARGRGLLRGRTWLLAASGLLLAVLISWSSLFLVGGLTFLLSASVGYVTTRGKIPWLVLGVLLTLVSILHAGKEEMRSRHWFRGANVGERTSLARIPGLVVEWFELGLESYGSESRNASALDRASLLQILLRVQRLTPQVVDYLRGGSYVLLPGMLVPRFLDPEKTKSQASMDLLNIRYGLLTVEDVEKTAVGWGLIAEAYANFGYFGITVISLIVGVASGALTRWSARASGISISTLFAVALLVGLVNLEQDLASLVTSLIQSMVAVLLFLGFLRFLPKHRPRLKGSAPSPGTRPASLRAF